MIAQALEEKSSVPEAFLWTLEFVSILSGRLLVGEYGGGVEEVWLVGGRCVVRVVLVLTLGFYSPPTVHNTVVLDSLRRIPLAFLSR
jgi:hypothetical protein